MRPLEAADLIILALPVVWFVVIIGGSVMFRRAQGKPIMAIRAENAVFQEGWTSARVRSGLRSLGGASRCVRVAVTRDQLIVTPHFPMTLMFLPEVWGLDLRQPLSRIESVTDKRGLLGRRIDVAFSDGGGMVFRLRDPDAFIRALNQKVTSVPPVAKAT